jgi:coenzyme F420 hydrogenase subunit beta
MRWAGLASTVEVVKRRRLCTSCGVCAGVCPTRAIEMVVAQHGTWVPSVDAERCSRCGICLKVCAGHAFSFEDNNISAFGKLPECPEIGNFEGIHAAWCTDAEIRGKCQSGGVTSALLIDLLSRGVIDGAVVTRWTPRNPLQAEAFVARTRAEVLEAVGSKYCPVPVGLAIREVLETDGKYAFVGTACQIQSLRKAESLDGRLKDRILLRVGLFCIGVFTLHFFEYVLRRVGLSAGDVQSFQYRDKQCAVRIATHDGRALGVDGRWGRLAPRPFFTAWRCQLCGDKLNEFADIALGDCRVARAYGAETSEAPSYYGKLGKSHVITRTSLAEQILRDMQRRGIVELTSLTWAETLCTTSVSEKKLGLHVFARLARSVGRGVPDCGVTYAPVLAPERAMVEGARRTCMTLAISARHLVGDLLRSYGIYRWLLRKFPPYRMELANRWASRTTGYEVLHGASLVAEYQHGDGSVTCASSCYPRDDTSEQLAKVWGRIVAELACLQDEATPGDHGHVICAISRQPYYRDTAAAARVFATEYARTGKIEWEERANRAIDAILKLDVFDGLSEPIWNRHGWHSKRGSLPATAMLIDILLPVMAQLGRETPWANAPRLLAYLDQCYLGNGGFAHDAVDETGSAHVVLNTTAMALCMMEHALAGTFGPVADEVLLRQRISDARELITRSQRRDGLWAYVPPSRLQRIAFNSRLARVLVMRSSRMRRAFLGRGDSSIMFADGVHNAYVMLFLARSALVRGSLMDADGNALRKGWAAIRRHLVWARPGDLRYDFEDEPVPTQPRYCCFFSTSVYFLILALLPLLHRLGIRDAETVQIGRGLLAHIASALLASGETRPCIAPQEGPPEHTRFILPHVGESVALRGAWMAEWILGSAAMGQDLRFGDGRSIPAGGHSTEGKCT